MGREIFTVADYLLARLKEVGVDHLFGVVGDFSLGLFKRVYKSKVKMVCTCNELNAAYAADGYARVHGMGGVVSTYVVGELSAINGIAGAYAENLPVIKITGCPALKHYHNRTLLHHTLGDYEIPLRMYREVTVAAQILKEPSIAPDEIDHLIQSALFYSKPVYLGIPADLVITPCKKPSSRLIIPKRTSAFPANLKAAARDAAALLNKAKKPLILLDFETVCYRLKTEVEALVKKSGYPFATMMLSKTSLDESHPQFIGTYMGNRSRAEVQKQVETSDGVLALGLKLTDFNSGGFSTQFPSGKTVCASMGSVKIGDRLYDGVDLKEFLDEIAAQLNHRKTNIESAHQDPKFTKALDFKPIPNKKLTVKRFFERMATFLKEDTIMIAETGSALFAGAEMTFLKGAKFMTQTFFGSIGYTVGSTLGVAVGAPKKRVVLIVGDGSFQLTCQEVSTMIRYGLDPIIIVINNDGYLVERVIGDGPFNDLQQWEYGKIPETFGGGWGCKVKTEGELEAALEKAWKNKGVSCIDLIVGKWDSPDSMTKAGASMAKTNFISD